MSDIATEIRQLTTLVETAIEVGNAIIDGQNKISQQQTLILKELTAEPEDGDQMADCLRQILALSADTNAKVSTILGRVTKTA